MKKQIQKSIAGLTLMAFLGGTLFGHNTHAYELNNHARGTMLAYADYTERGSNLSSLDLLKHLEPNLDLKKQETKEIFEVLDQAHLASKGKWAKVVSLDTQNFEVSFGTFVARVRYSSLDPNVVEINSKTFVLNPKKTLKQNAESIVQELSKDSSQSNRFYFVSKVWNSIEDKFFPKAQALSGWVWAGIALAVVGIIVAIVGINKKKKAEEKQNAENSAQRSALRAKHAAYMESRQYHDQAKKGHLSETEESESSEEVAATDETVEAVDSGTTQVASSDGASTEVAVAE